MYFLGIDIGSSSIKVSVLDGEKGTCIDTTVSPEKELSIEAPKTGWAEQDPEIWWQAVTDAVNKLIANRKFKTSGLGGIGLAYQMHGLVAVDKQMKPVRPAIIWCDSRAVGSGAELLLKAGKEKCLNHLLNSPGNFTLSKLYWVKNNEPEVFNRIDKIMLPGDYIALKMTGEVTTTITGLSEGILWDFKENGIASFLLESAGIYPNKIAATVPIFGFQGKLTKSAAEKLNLPAGIPVTYRSGDQANNAFSLNVLNPGEIAATAGTSGVVYGVTDQYYTDSMSRVNTFAHVNHSPSDPRLGVLLCINGTGISNNWIREITASGDYEAMNKKAQTVAAGSDGLVFIPFGNGAERMLQNRETGSSFHLINFNIHRQEHLLRAVQEGVAFAFNYGIKIMNGLGMDNRIIRAGQTNMFLSDLFCTTLSTLSGVTIELYNTDGSLGAARGAALGAGFYKSPAEAFSSLKRMKTIDPEPSWNDLLDDAYKRWENTLIRLISQK